jgi:hypothetical protein
MQNTSNIPTQMGHPPSITAMTMATPAASNEAVHPPFTLLSSHWLSAHLTTND